MLFRFQTLLGTLALVCCTSASVTAATWTEVAMTGPSARFAHGLAFDQARGVMVLFGGGTSEVQPYPLYDETWEWNGSSWTQVALSGPRPSPRRDMHMAYDSDRHVVVLFGGFDGCNQLGDTWEWDGSTWNEKTPTSAPHAREIYAMTYDSDRHVVLLFGGSYCSSTCTGCGGFAGSTIFNDTWTWDGSTWTQVATTGPPPRAYTEMAYDSDRHVAVLFGGALGDQSPTNETWEWDGSSWTPAATTGPAPRINPSVAYDSDRGVTVLFGGTDNANPTPTLFDDTWEWNGTSWTQVNVSGPSGRSWSELAYDNQRHVAVTFGGYTYTSSAVLADTWELDTWDLGACTERLAMCRGDLGSTEGTLATCQADLGSAQATLSQTIASLNQCQTDLAASQVALSQTTATLAQVEADLAVAVADSDGDGVYDAADACPATPSSAMVDQLGCSQEQFCEHIDVSTSAGRKACKKADWRNDEPVMKGKEADCRLDRQGDGTQDDRCISAAP